MSLLTPESEAAQALLNLHNIMDQDAPMSSTPVRGAQFHQLQHQDSAMQRESQRETREDAQFQRALSKFYRKIDHAVMILRGRLSQVACDREIEALGRALDDLEAVGDNCPTDVDGYLGRATGVHADIMSRLYDASENISETSQKVKLEERSQQAQAKTVAQVQFSKLAAPKWDGSFRTYLGFKREFKDLVEKFLHEDLALIRLKRECLRPKSTELQLAEGAKSLEKAWEALDRLYGDEEIIKDCIIAELRSLKKVTKAADGQGLRDLVTEVKRAKCDLEECGRGDALGDAAFSHLMGSIPNSLREKIDYQFYDSGPLTCERKIAIFLDTVEKHANIQKSHQLRMEAHALSASGRSEDSQTARKPIKGTNPSIHLNSSPESGLGFRESRGSAGKETPQESRGYQTQSATKPKPGSAAPKPPQGRDSAETGKQGNRPKCLIHPTQTHPTARCRALDAMSSLEIKDLFEKNGHCIKCMGDHPSIKCSKPIRCPEPGCPKPETHCRQVHTAMKFGDSKGGSCGVVSTSQIAALDQPKGENVDDFLGLNTVRPCHTGYLKAKTGGCLEVNVFYDMGSDLSEVAIDTVNATPHEPVQVVPKLLISVAGALQSEDWGESPLYRLPIYDATGKCMFVAKCVGVKHIGYTREARFDGVKDLFSDHDLESLIPPSSGRIDILVGANMSHVHPTPIAHAGSVTLAESCFGLHLFGSHPTFPVQDFHRKQMSEYLISMSTISCDVIFPHEEDRAHRQHSLTVRPWSAAADQVCPPETGGQSLDQITADQQVSVASLKSELDAYDRAMEIDEQPICYKCETCPTGPSGKSKEEERLIQVYQDCLRYDDENKIFVAKMPWKSDFSSLPFNKEAAMKRLAHLTQSTAKDPVSRDRYRTEFSKLIENGILQEVTDDELCQWRNAGGKAWFVAHFPAFNDHSASTPLRIVFDPTMPYRGVLLDRLWEDPPNMIPLLPKLLALFRERRVPVAMDVSKCYWSVHLEEVESFLHMVVYNELDSDQPPKMYRMTRNSWGMKPAGAIATVAMNMLAERYQHEYPKVHSFITSQTYVDDGTFSVDDIDTAVQLAKDTCWVLMQGGFRVKHFIIGGKSVEIEGDQVTESDTLPDILRVGGDTERILGINWTPDDDSLQLACRVNFSKKRKGVRSGPDIPEDQYDELFPRELSRRMFLSQHLSVFDVLGLASAYSIMPKHEFGRICQLDLGWDEPIPYELDDTRTSVKRCQEIIRMTYDLAKVSFPRCIRPLGVPGDAQPVVVIFCDSSQTAYGAVAYFNWETTSGVRESRLYIAKSKPFPKKGPIVSIPRGELMGALTGARLWKFIQEVTSYSVSKVFLISDSTSALSQLRHPPIKFKTWVGSKVDEIQQCTSTDDWYHIESDLNVADDVTRGLDPKSMGPDSRWQQGEAFMQLPLSEWPIKPVHQVAMKIGTEPAVDKVMEVRHQDPRMTPKTGASIHAVETDIVQPQPAWSTPSDLSILKYLDNLPIKAPDPNDNWAKLRRTVARIIAYLENPLEYLKKLKNGRASPLPNNFAQMGRQAQRDVITKIDKFVPTARQMKLATAYWVRRAQSSLTEKEVNQMQDLGPVQDDLGIWRARGRTITVKTSVPIIPAGPLARVLLSWYHKVAHAGYQGTIAAVRDEFWITKCPTIARELVRNCGRCKILRKRVAEVEMAPLREAQCSRSDVFKTVVIDLCGPYQVKSGFRTTRARSEGGPKVWILVVLCSASRAVHCEIVEGYDTANLLSSLHTFVDLRGRPVKIIADQGSQIKGAKGTVEYLWDNVDITRLQNDYRMTLVTPLNGSWCPLVLTHSLEPPKEWCRV